MEVDLPSGSEGVDGACPLCRGAGQVEFAENDHLHSRCAACGVVFLTFPPPPAVVCGLYARDRGRTYDTTTEGGLWRERRLEARRKLAALSTWLSPRPGRFLEIGCGSGALLCEVRARGWDVEGLDLSPAFAEEARRRWGLTVRTGTLVEAGYPERSLGAVGMFDVLSHLRDPVGELTEIERVLRPGGVLLLETGNGGELEQMDVPCWGAPEHIFHYSERSLRALLEGAGLQVLGIVRRSIRLQRGLLRWANRLRGPGQPAEVAAGPVTIRAEPRRSPTRALLRWLWTGLLLTARFDLGRVGARPGVLCTLLAAARKT